MEHSIISRFGEPTSMDQAIFGTICKLIHSENNKDADSIEVYLQISQNEESPKWTYMGTYNSSISDADLYNHVHKKLLSKQL